MACRANPIRASSPTRPWVSLVFLAFWGCGGGQAPQTGVAVVQADNRAVLAVVRQALEGEPLGLATDSLYTPTALVVANGATRTQPPRFAGLAQGGRVTITEMSGEVFATTAWTFASYRWRSSDDQVMELGVATLLLTRDDVTGNWRIKHAHSSLLPPWENR